MRAIGFIVDDEPTKNSKDTGKRSQASMSKAKEKESSNLESLTCLVQSLSNEMVELKHRSTKTTVSRKPPRFKLFGRTTTSCSSSNQPTKSAQSSNFVFNIEHLSTDQYCSYYQERHSEKKFPQWNQAMSMLTTSIVDSVMVEKKNEPIEEKEEGIVADETPIVGHAINMFNYILTTQKSTTNK